MTPLKRAVAIWCVGLVAFAVVVALSLPLAIAAVPGGIIDHQSAGTAMEAGRIQAAWRSAGLDGAARIAMIADLVFIGIYGVGALMVGRAIRRNGAPATRAVGLAAMVAAVLFLVTDYAETLSQIIQLLSGRGDDFLAGLAASVRPVKMAAWIASAVLVLLGLALSRRPATKA